MLFVFMLYLFAACMLYNYVANGGSFVLFSGAVDVVRGFREKTPRNATVNKNSISVEFKVGSGDKARLYSIIIPKNHSMPWTQAAACINDVWTDVTPIIAHCAGPFKNFYEIPITPRHINSEFDKLGFQFTNMEPVVVGGNEFIIAKLREALRKRSHK